MRYGIKRFSKSDLPYREVKELQKKLERVMTVDKEECKDWVWIEIWEGYLAVRGWPGSTDYYTKENGKWVWEGGDPVKLPDHFLEPMRVMIKNGELNDCPPFIQRYYKEAEKILSKAKL